MNKQRHLELAAHFEQSVVELEKNGKFPAWCVVGLFYTALHYVDAFLDKNVGKHPACHFNKDNQDESRYHLLNSLITPADKKAFDQYETLGRYSRDARYDALYWQLQRKPENYTYIKSLFLSIEKYFKPKVIL